MSKHELILEGLDCANCAAKIERDVRDLHGIEACSVNFMTKTLSVEIEETKQDQLLIEARALIKKLEPHVQVIEKHTNQQIEKTFYLQGLDCANCASKIEMKVGLLSEVSSSSLDFVSKKLKVVMINSAYNGQIEKDVTEIVEKLEPDVEVILDRPGRVTTEHHQEDGSKSTNRILIRIGIAAVLMGVAMIGSLPAMLEFVLYVGAYLIVGGDVLIKAIRNIFRGHVFDENFLMAVATIGAFGVKQFPEGVAVMLFYQVGELFQGMAVNRSRKSISTLMDIRPELANVKTEMGTKQVSPEEVHVGEIIVIKPGEKVPLDGIVIDGMTMVDTSTLTGESVPRKLEIGDEVLSGYINTNGLITVEVRKEFGDSTVSKILELVQNASSRKAPTENFITKFARYYTPVVVITALLLALTPPLVMADEAFSVWIYRALVFLVISCPCALVISIPLGFFGGIGGASKKGILIKGSNYLEAMNDVKYVVFDKTGTLTKGVFEVTKIVPQGAVPKETLLGYAACAEVHSSHPIAQSIRKAYGIAIDESSIDHYEEIAGFGTFVIRNQSEILAGNAKLMQREMIQSAQPKEFGTIVHVAVDKQYVGYIVISDQVKEDSATAIQQLKELGIKKTVMLTGDSKEVAESVGKQLGIDEVYAELLPHQKVEQIELLDSNKGSKEKIIFVGDGINDTPVLARADIGMAMGGLGSDAAIEVADVVIMTDETSKIPTAIKLAKRTRQIVWQNIIFALGVKGVFLLLGAFGYATMWEAVFSDVGVTVLAIMNSMRVLRVQKI